MFLPNCFLKLQTDAASQTWAAGPSFGNEKCKLTTQKTMATAVDSTHPGGLVNVELSTKTIKLVWKHPFNTGPQQVYYSAPATAADATNTWVLKLTGITVTWPKYDFTTGSPGNKHIFQGTQER